MMTYKDYIKEGIGENEVLEYWIEQPFFKPSDFKEAIEVSYNNRLKFVTKNELSFENEIEFIKEELADLQGLIGTKPSYDYERLSFAQKISGDCWFSDETLKEFRRYFKEYYNYKFRESKADYLKNRLKDLLEPTTAQPQPKAKDFTKENWFKVGLCFATGEIHLLLAKQDGNATKTAALLGNEKGFRPYITESIANTNKRSDKNLFAKNDKIIKIHSYCIEKEIPMCEDFLSKYNQIEPK